MNSAQPDTPAVINLTPESISGVEQSLPDDLGLPIRVWPAADFDAPRCLARGALLGAIAGCVSLLLNVIGSVAWPVVSGAQQHPLRLIQVFLTFPLGERALELNYGLLLACGCLLYLATGLLYGALFEVVTEYFFPRAGMAARLMIFSLLALAVWVVNFYGVLSWLQPLAFNGRWILDLIPWWVAAVTHLAFGGAMALIHPPTRPTGAATKRS